MNTPVELLDAAFAALNLEDWSGFSGLCDPVSLQAFKRDKITEYTEDFSDFDVDADDLMDAEPDLPREVAEYEAAKMNRYRSAEHRISKDFPGVSDIEELREMEPGRFFALWVRMQSPHRRVDFEAPLREEPWETGADYETAKANEKKKTRAYRYRVIGSVVDGDAIAHVMFKTENGIDKIFEEEYGEWLSSISEDEQLLARQLHHGSRPEFATCRRQADGSWRLVAKWDFILMSSLQNA